MKILIIANGSGSLFALRKELIARLQQNHTVYAAAPESRYIPDLQSMGVHMIITPLERRGSNPLKELQLVSQYKKIIDNVQPDFVITYTIKPNIYGGYVCQKAGIPYASNVTGLGTAFQKKGLFRFLVTRMNRFGLKKAKVVFFENEDNRQCFIRMGIVDKEQTCLLNGAGVNVNQYSLTDYPSVSDTTRFLFIGRVMKEKGIEELFSSMKRLRAEGYSVELHILGNYEEHYEMRIKECESEGWLFYHGYQRDIRPFVVDCHCAVLPSYHEGMANVNLECASMGRPLITSRIHGCMEAVEEGKSGLLCEKQNADSLYEAMKTFISLPHEQKAAMGLAGRKHMEEVFEKSKVVEATVKGLGL